MIEQIDDVVSDILNRLGIYGGCDDKCTKDNPCRCHAESALKSRIMAAVEVEQLLNAQNTNESPDTPTTTHNKQSPKKRHLYYFPIIKRLFANTQPNLLKLK